MISKDSLTAEWLKAVSSGNRNADKILVEKVMRALLLLEGLVKSELQFVFKGGTALMLLLGSTKRLSIDIDIIVSKNQELEERFKGLLKEQDFNRIELNERKTASDIEKAHYKFYYTPIHQYGQAEDYVLLDILFEEQHYIKLIDMPIHSSFVKQDGEPLIVQIPCHEDILGDKLTAFAPNTTGIPYEKNGDLRTMEMMKQLFDIGSLLEQVQNTGIIIQTFEIFANTELGYRNCDAGVEGVLQDIYDTALHICSRGEAGKGDLRALVRGMTQVRRFIFSENYHLERAITDAAKAAYLSAAIRYKVAKLVKFEGVEQVQDLVIDGTFNGKIQRLKRTNPEAFFYWYQVSVLQTSASG